MLNVLVILATLGAALMVFDPVRAFGASLFAGLQLAITQPIALGDVVEVENVVGTIEEITFSFVSVRLRDLRRLILPVTYFLERPFTNWTLCRIAHIVFVGPIFGCVAASDTQASGRNSARQSALGRRQTGSYDQRTG
jgi:Mechanosensitive ion channel, beta-domain